MTTLQKVKRRAEQDAESRGYYLNPDPDFLKTLLEGLKENEERFEYPACPCRLASGKFEWDRDIICPCDYRDPDVEEFGQCYCALYVRKDVFDGKTPIEPIPERRPQEKIDRALGEAPSKEEKVVRDMTVQVSDTNLKFWYCEVCGYVAFREDPPHICPICKAKRERFKEIILDTTIHVR